MKNKFLIILFSFVSIVTISCDDDDDTKGIDSKTNPFVGKWAIEQIGEIQNINNTNVVVYTDVVNTSSCENDYYVFNEDLTYSANEVETSNCQVTTAQSGTYVIGGDTITFTYQEIVNNQTETYTYTATIMNLTDDTLEVSFGDISGGVSFLKFSKQ